MALVGGGGAGNVAGSNPSGTGTSLNYVGSHAYAYSAAFEMSTSSIVALNFNTGSEYLVGKFSLCSGVEFAQADIAGTYMRIKLNDEQIWVAYTGTGAVDTLSASVVDIILSPFTNVVVEVWSVENDANDFANVLFSGRIY